MLISPINYSGYQLTGQGRRKDICKGGGVVLNVTYIKGYFCTNLFPNTLYRICIKFAPKNNNKTITLSLSSHTLGYYSNLYKVFLSFKKVYKNVRTAPIKMRKLGLLLTLYMYASI